MVVLALATASHETRGGSGTLYVVDTTADTLLTTCSGNPGDCSLRGAISRANSGSSPDDVINFDSTVFPAGSPATISITSPVGQLTGGLDTIDATGRGVIVDAVNVEPGRTNFSCLVIVS